VRSSVTDLRARVIVIGRARENVLMISGAFLQEDVAIRFRANKWY
jgi:hypothetical protein